MTNEKEIKEVLKQVLFKSKVKGMYENKKPSKEELKTRFKLEKR